MEMPFGKYRGWDVGEIPADYLEWVLDNVEIRSESLYEAIEAVLNGTYSRQRRQQTASPPPPPPPPSTASGTAGGTLEKVVRAWHRQMTLKYHPDRGGTHEQMLVVNEGAELLRRLAGLN